MTEPNVDRKPIPGFAGYEADEFGRIWTLKGQQARVLTETHVLLDRYVSVRLSVDGRRIRKDVHPLVASAFHGPKPPDCETRHLNGDRRDNRPTNLTWGTKLDNAADARAHGRTPRGDRNGMSLAAQRRRMEL